MKTKKVFGRFIFKSLLFCFCFLLVGCTTSHIESGNPDLSLVEPITRQFSLDEIPVARYMIKVSNEQGQEEDLEFNWPWYAAIGGKIQNESGVFERAAAGQIDQSTVVGMATRKYFLWSGHRAKAVRVAMRDQTDWNEVRKVLMEVAGEGSILAKLTPLPPEIIEQQVYRQNIPPEFFITGSLTEVTIAEESSAAGFNFAGIGASHKIVQTSVAGSLEITDPYTGELVVAVMGQNRITAEQVGAEGYRIVSFGGDEEYLNVELTTAKEMIKQQVQVELVDYLFYKAFKELYELKPDYLTNRLHYRLGRVQGYAQELAASKGLTVVGNAVPVSFEIVEQTEPNSIELPQPESDVPGTDESEPEDIEEPAQEQEAAEISEPVMMEESESEVMEETEQVDIDETEADVLEESAPEEETEETSELQTTEDSESEDIEESEPETIEESKPLDTEESEPEVIEEPAQEEETEEKSEPQTTEDSESESIEKSEPEDTEESVTEDAEAPIEGQDIDNEEIETGTEDMNDVNLDQS